MASRPMTTRGGRSVCIGFDHSKTAAFLCWTTAVRTLLLYPAGLCRFPVPMRLSPQHQRFALAFEQLFQCATDSTHVHHPTEGKSRVRTRRQPLFRMSRVICL